MTLAASLTFSGFFAGKYVGDGVLTVRSCCGPKNPRAAVGLLMSTPEEMNAAAGKDVTYRPPGP